MFLNKFFQTNSLKIYNFFCNISSYKLATLVQEDETLSQFIAGVNMQVLKPAMEEEFNWTKAELKAVLRIRMWRRGLIIEKYLKRA